MFPAAQTEPAPTGADAAPSLADIVHEQTQGGRLIVRFFLSTMEGEFEDAKIHHRVDAAKQLIILQQKSSFADVVRYETHNGDRVIRFLFSTMMGEFEDAKQHHRNEAGKQLAKLDPGLARAFSQDNATRRSRGHDRRSREGGNPSLAAHTGDVDAAVADAAQQLADIIREETNNGRDIARFFIDVMEGTLTGFNQRFRFAAALVLINRGYDVVAARCPDTAAHAPQPAPYSGTDADTPDTVPETTWKWKPEWTHFEYPEDNTYDFSSYGEDDYHRDVYGDKALVHIFGDDEAKSASNQAVLDYKVDQIEAQRAAVHSDYDTCQPYDPCSSCRVPDPPDDDSFGQHTYGYNALVYIYSDKATARVGYMGAMDHKEKIRLSLLAADDAHDPVDPGNGPDPPPKPRKRRAIAYF